ncbi:MAG TPA: CBS domain-containing protein [Phnomibacter sp.]|nr:CBS domain-containing protein [Phnomibacter sp.]
MRTVADILEAKSVITPTIDPHALVIDALHIMKAENISYVVALENGTFKGIFSERDYARNVALEGKSSSNCPVRQAMSVGMPVVTTYTTAEECIHMMLESKARYLPVIEEGKWLGVITIHDVLREALRSKEAVFDSYLTERLINEGGSIY